MKQLSRSYSSPLKWRVAVIGSGPAGFYAIGELFKQQDHLVKVDLFDRLPTPYGLVRGGVAPDHQKIKSVCKIFDRIAIYTPESFTGYSYLGTKFKHPTFFTFWFTRHTHATAVMDHAV